MRPPQKLQSEPQPEYEVGPGGIGVNGAGYLIWKTSAGRACRNRAHNTWRNWKLVKYNNAGTYGDIGTLGKIRLPKHYAGKRIRIKIEVIEDEPTPKKLSSSLQRMKRIMKNDWIQIKED